MHYYLYRAKGQL